MKELDKTAHSNVSIYIKFKIRHDSFKLEVSIVDILCKRGSQDSERTGFRNALKSYNFLGAGGVEKFTL